MHKQILALFACFLLVMPIAYSEEPVYGEAAVPAPADGTAGEAAEPISAHADETSSNEGEKPRKTDFPEPRKVGPGEGPGSRRGPYEGGKESGPRGPPTRVSARTISAEHYGPAPPKDFSPREMIIGMFFDRAMRTAPDAFDEEDYIPLCPDAEKMVDTAIAKMKKLGIFSIKEACSEIESRAVECKEKSGNQCERIQKGDFGGNRGGPPLSCPPDKNSVVNWCVEKSKEHETKFKAQMEKMKERQKNSCSRQFDRMERECKRNEEQREREEKRMQEDRDRREKDNERRRQDDDRRRNDDQRRQEEYRRDDYRPAEEYKQDYTQPTDSGTTGETTSGDSGSGSSEGSSGSTDSSGGSTDSGSSGSSDSGSSSPSGDSGTPTGQAIGYDSGEYGGDYKEEYRQEYERKGFGGERREEYGSPQGEFRGEQREFERHDDFGGERGFRGEDQQGQQGGWGSGGGFRGSSDGGEGFGPSGGDFGCDSSKEEFTDQCMEMIESNIPDFEAEAKDRCEEEAEYMIEDFQDMCEEREEHYAECLEHSQDACSFADEAAEECNSMTEDDIRNEMIHQASFMCKTAKYRGDYDSGKSEKKKFRHLKGAPNADEVVPGLLKARDNAPDEFKSIIDSEADGFLELNDELETLEDKEDAKGVVYKLKKLLGLAAEEERKDAEAIKNSADRLGGTIENLQAVAEQLEEPTAKAAILEQVESLIERQKALDELAAKKENTARGLLSYITGEFLKEE